MDTIQYKLKAATGALGDSKACFKAEMASPHTVEIEEFVNYLAKTMNMSTTMARFTVNAMSETIQDLLSKGIGVKLDLAWFKPVLKPATFPTVDADLSEAQIVGDVVPTRTLRKPLRLAAENVVKIPRLLTHEFGCDGFRREGDIAPGYMCGWNTEHLKINPEREDEGIFLEDRKGNVISKAEIVKEVEGTLEFYFHGEVKPGKNYRLSYCTRLGEDLSHTLIKQYSSHKIIVRDPKDAVNPQYPIRP